MSDENINIPPEERQCRICLDGVDSEPELGRLIRPCLCKGSISYVHVKCLQRWRNSSTSNSAFFACPQCRYQYRFARTQILGLASNPVIVGGLSGIIFTMIVMFASFITTFFMSSFESERTDGYYSMFFISPFEVAQDLVGAALRVIQDEDSSIIGDAFSNTRGVYSEAQRQTPGFIKRFIGRFLLGLPLVGAGSLVHMLLSVQLLAPVQWLARYRGRRSRRRNSRDTAALIVVGLLIMGALRALYQVYRMTEAMTKRILLRAEDAILEVN